MKHDDDDGGNDDHYDDDDTNLTFSDPLMMLPEWRWGISLISCVLPKDDFDHTNSPP